ncbi:MAG: HD domain-containing protein [Clostridiaceae bacterium]|mgnify:CR=1 FL=1|nr:HD domain-containing protein [Clostridiaceae bacterium]
MKLSRLQQQMQFLKEIDKLKSIYRQNYLSDGSRRENDSEHSWHLAMMVIILSEHFEGIDTLKTLKMVLIHDLVEIYAGDTFAYDEKANLDKELREKIAAQKIFSLLPPEQAAEFTGLWEEFERMDSTEALCAASVDRIQPLTLNICSKGKMWHEHRVTVEKVLKRNKLVLDRAPEVISEYVRETIAEAAENKCFYSELPNEEVAPINESL